MKNKIVENNELIHEVQSSISSTFQQISLPVANSNTPQASATHDSPLIYAINSDMISEIREKCDQIEIKMNYLTENLSKINIQTSNTASNPSSIEEYTETLGAPTVISSSTQTSIDLQSFQCPEHNSSLTTGNPTAMSMHIQEAMTHLKNTNNVPETSNFKVQKRQKMPNSSGSRPGIESIDISTNISTTEESALSALRSLEFPDDSIAVTPTLQIANKTDAINIVSDLDQEICISNFDNKTTCKNIENYISHKGNFDMSKIKVIRLTKKGQDLSLLSFISFKIETKDPIATQLLQPEFWPINCTSKRFVRKHHTPKSVASMSGVDFLSPIATEIQTT